MTFARTPDAIVATVAGSSVRVADHLAALLVLDAGGRPITLDYGTGTTRAAGADGTLAAVSVPTKGASVPPSASVVLMIDTTLAARGTLQ